MMLVPIVLIAAIGVPVGLAVSMLTADLSLRVELTVAFTVLLFAAAMLLWRWTQHRSKDPAETARLAWLNAPPDVVTRKDESADPGTVDSWRILNAGELEHRAASLADDREA